MKFHCVLMALARFCVLCMSSSCQCFALHCYCSAAVETVSVQEATGLSFPTLPYCLGTPCPTLLNRSACLDQAAREGALEGDLCHCTLVLVVVFDATGEVTEPREVTASAGF